MRNVAPVTNRLQGKTTRMLRRILLAILMLLASSFTCAKEYGHHDPKRMLTVAETPAGKKHGLDLRYLDQMLNDLALHARNYPPQFDTAQDRQRAVQDVKMLSGMLDILIAGPSPNAELLARAGFLNSIGHNLDIPGSTEKTAAIFNKLLTAAPADPRGNYMYGAFLAGAGKSREAIPYLEKALAVGIADAAYSLGMAYLTLGDKQKALQHLDVYQQRNPNDGNVAKLIDGIRNGTLEIKRKPG